MPVQKGSTNHRSLDTLEGMRIEVVPCLRDNYAYLVVCEETNRAAIVDTPEAAPILDAIAKSGVRLVSIWNTHHHWDHTGANEELKKKFPAVEIFGHVSDKGRIPGQTVYLNDGDTIWVGEEIQAKIIHNPGHTTGAISYYVKDGEAVFTGDTLFLSGCGRLFEGSPADMNASLSQLAQLPSSTQVYCGHEYTVSNLKFAAALEPQNKEIAERLSQASELRDNNQPTIPGTMAEELATNPFIRVQSEELQESLRSQKEAESIEMNDSDQVLGAVRKWKNRF